MNNELQQPQKDILDTYDECTARTACIVAQRQERLQTWSLDIAPWPVCNAARGIEHLPWRDMLSLASSSQGQVLTYGWHTRHRAVVSCWHILPPGRSECKCLDDGSVSLGTELEASEDRIRCLQYSDTSLYPLGDPRPGWPPTEARMPAGVLLSRGSWVSMVLKVASVLHPSLRHHSMPGGRRLMVFSGICQ